jgi:chromosome segregation ATPase
MSDTSGEELVELRADNKSLKQENARLLRDRNDATTSCNDAVNSSQQLVNQLFGQLSQCRDQLNQCRAELDAQGRSNADLSRRLAVCEHKLEVAVKSQTGARGIGAAPAGQRALSAVSAAALLAGAAPGSTC